MSHAASKILAGMFVAALFTSGAAHASTIYKCTDAKGAVTMQNDTPSLTARMTSASRKASSRSAFNR